MIQEGKKKAGLPEDLSLKALVWFSNLINEGVEVNQYKYFCVRDSL